MNQDSDTADKALRLAWLNILAGGQQGQPGDDRSGNSASSSAVIRSLVDLLPLYLLVKDPNGRRVFANRSYLDLEHEDRGDVLGKTDFDLFPAEVAQKYRADDQQVLQSGAVLRGLEERHLADGRRQWIERVKGPIRNADGDIVGIQVLFWDATDKIKAEAAFDLERDLLKSLMDNIPDAIYFKDDQSRFLRVSQSQVEKFGLEHPDDAIGKSDADIFTAEHAEKALDDEREIMKTGRPLVAHVEKETWADREDTWVSTTKMPLRNKDGEIIGTFGISRDVTELKRTQDALTKARDAAEAASRAKSDFLANVSHEIRTPMNGIIGMTELLLNTNLTSEQREYQTIVKNSAQALLSLLNSILDFSKSEAGKLELERLPFGVRDTLGETLHTLAAQASEKGLELAVRIPPEVPDRLVGDAARLRQIVVNLVGNAIKFTDEGEVVVNVSLETRTEREASLRFEVRDTGSGISEDKQAIVFEAFSQADASTTRNFGGTGLGLAISSHLVRLMGGRIWLDSTPGEGSSFYFTTCFATDNNGYQLPAALESLKQLPVLVVDDNRTNRFICEEMLKNWNMRPTSVESGPEALSALRHATDTGEPFRVMLLDVMMPGMDGWEVVRRVQQDAALNSVAIIILSSAGRSRHTEEETLPVAYRLTKPVTQSDLLNAITSASGVASGMAEPSGSILSGRPADFVPRRVLLAEDGLVNQKVATSLLEKRGHEVTVVTNGQEAVEAIAHDVFDVVLMDVQMPVMDGYEATAEIRRRERGSEEHLPIIAMTAHAMKGDRQRCLNAGMDSYIAKPFRPPELFRRVEVTGPRTDRPAATSTPAAASDNRPFDYQQALANVGGSGDLFCEMVELFATERTVQMDAIDDAHSAGDTEQLARAAHTLKGSVSMFAAQPALDAALRVEQLARDQNLDDYDAAWKSLQYEIQTLMAALEQSLSGRQSSGSG